MKILFRCALLLLITQLVSSCQREADIRPASYDELALAPGHWEWESSSYQAGLRTPASVGFSRRLVFGPQGQLTVHRGGQADYHTGYQLSMGTPQPCGSAPVPLVTYTSEADLDNTRTKLYRLAQRDGQPILTIQGEALCLDGGAAETYHWVAE